jgi:hypothetical protein
LGGGGGLPPPPRDPVDVETESWSNY